MGKGKLVAQCCHGTLNSYKEAPNRTVLTSWEWSGQPKVVVKVKSLEELLQIKEIAEKLHVPSCLVRDAGRTQIAPGTETVLSVGPDVISKIDEVTGHLKLL
ncbi:UNVERIFIED_CONTAM: hypothetical protein GTU68_034373 [Idotea baltica]|nr:hypothetical protein [Idotea baltica]